MPEPQPSSSTCILLGVTRTPNGAKMSQHGYPRSDQQPRLVVSVVLLFATACGSSAPQPAAPEEPASETRETRMIEASSREVEIPASELTLRGVLDIPARQPDATLPAIVLVHGSGPNSRDATLTGQLNMAFGFQIPVFAQLSAQLVEAGYAVLRYDKRTCGPFNGCADNGYPAPSATISAREFIDDAAAAVDFLAGQPEVDAERVVVLGHSQGGTFVPALMQQRPTLVAGVMVAANHRPMDAIMEHQLDFSRQMLEQAGADPVAVLAPLTGTIAALHALRAGEHSGGAIGGAPVEFWQSMFEIGDEAPGIAAALDRPILAIGGEYDWNVPIVELDAWRATFATSDADPGHRVVSVPCMTHALNCVSQPDYRAITPADIGQTVDPALTEQIHQFLGAVLGE